MISKNPDLNPMLRLLVSRPGLGPLLALVLTVIFVLGLTRFERDPSAYLIEYDHPYRIPGQEIDQRFTGSGELSILVLTHEQGSPINPETFALMQRLCKAIEGMALVREKDVKKLEHLARRNPETRELAKSILSGGIDAADTQALSDLASRLTGKDQRWADELFYRVVPVRRVRSLTQIEDIRMEDDWLYAGKLIEEPLPANPVVYPNLATRITSNPLYLDSMISRDGKAVAIQVEYAIPADNSLLMIEAHEALKRIVNDQGAEDIVSYSGSPVVMVEVGRAMKQDNERLFPLVLLVMSLILAACLRSVGGVVLTLSVAILTVVWTLGFMSLVSVPLNVVTNAMPVVLITIAVADAIHFINRVQIGLVTMKPAQAVEMALVKLWRPMLLTSITTAVGFMTIAITFLDYIRHFGLFLSAGTLFALAITGLLLPGLLIKHPRLAGRLRSRAAWTAKGPIPSMVRSLLNHPRAFLVTVGIIGVGSVYLGSGIRAGFSNIYSFGEDTELRRDHERIGVHYDSMIPTELWIHTDKDRGLIEPEAMRFLDSIEARFRQHPEVGYVVGPAAFVKRINQVLHHDVPYELPTPLTSAVVGQYLFLYENGSGQEIRDFLDANYRNARILAVANTDEAKVWKKVADDVLEHAYATAPEGIHIEPSGHGWIARQIMVDVIRGQLASLAAALVLISLVMAYLFRSMVVGLIGITPVAFTLACNFAWMRALGVPLDIGTAMVAAITFGVGVDYSIHILAAIRDSDKTDWVDRVMDGVERVARPVTFNTFAMAGGFLVLLGASFGPIQHLGKFVAATLAFCALIALLIIPLLSERLKPAALAGTVPLLNSPQDPAAPAEFRP